MSMMPNDGQREVQIIYEWWLMVQRDDYTDIIVQSLTEPLPGLDHGELEEIHYSIFRIKILQFLM